MKKVWDGVISVDGVQAGAYTVEYDPSRPFRPTSFVAVCPCCGSAWAHMELQGAGKKEVHQPIVIPCEAHGGGVLCIYFDHVFAKWTTKFDSAALSRDFMILSKKVLDREPLHENTRIHML